VDDDADDDVEIAERLFNSGGGRLVALWSAVSRDPASVAAVSQSAKRFVNLVFGRNAISSEKFGDRNNWAPTD